MNVSDSAPRARSPQAVLFVVLSLLAAALLWFVGQKRHFLADYSLRSYGDYYWPRRSGLILHLAYRAGLLGLNVAWVVTTGIALHAISLRRIEQHREWMLRSYSVTFAFITFRLSEQILRHWITLPDDPVADDLDTAMAWACWAIPLLFAEPLIQWRSPRRQARAVATQATPGVTL